MAYNDPEARIQALISANEATIAQQFLAALVLVRDSIDLDELAELLALQRFDEAFRVVGRAAARLGASWADTYVHAGRETAEFLTSEVGEIVIGFDQTHTRAVNLMQENQLRLVRGFTEQQREATRQALIRGIANGANPREQARAFRNSIGLTQTQERWVQNYRENLSALDRRALDRALRDKRFDATVRRAIEEGKPLPQAKIDKMVERYRERMLKYRSEVIARTEALKATHLGVDEMYEQAIEAGELDPQQLMHMWNTAGDERVRGSHATMHMQEQPHGVPFVSGLGNMAYHPGTFGIAAEDIQCRCVRSTRILTPAEAGLVVNVVGF